MSPSALEAALAAELHRVREAEHGLHVRASHLQRALTCVRIGEDEGVVRARLEVVGVVVLCRPVAVESAT